MSSENGAAQLMSFRQYARHRGCAASTVSDAVKGKRLDAALAVDARGRRRLDAVIADRLWAENTDLSKAPGYVKARQTVLADSAPGEAPASLLDDADAASVPDAPGESRPPSLSEASAREKHFKAQLAELEYKRRSADLVPAKDVELRIADAYGRARTRLLGVPRKAKQLLPHLNHADVTVLDNLVREALEELAGPSPSLERESPEEGAQQ